MTFESPKKIYTKSASLDEEYQYVLDRKNQPRFIGNTLDKPQILLKRFFVQDANTKVQQTRKGEDFTSKEIVYFDNMLNHLILGTPTPLYQYESVPLDFLSESAVYLLSPIIKNQALFTIPGMHSNVLIIACNNIGISHKLISLNTNPLHKDVRLKTSSIDCTEKGKSKILFTNDELIISDFSNTS